MNNYSSLKIGVLALQGDFERHLFRLNQLGINHCEIRQATDLDNLDGIIIPGGESTTMSMLLDRFNIRESFKKTAQEIPVWGTCAGMIMMATEVDDDRVEPLSLMDMKVERNGYGRQVHSFYNEISVSLNGQDSILQASFIRAPLVSEYGDSVEVLLEFERSPILLRTGRCLASSFHTELDDDLTLTKFFADHFVLKYKE